MYSKEILDFFKKKGISIGDRVSISSRDMALEGEIMPKTEAGDRATIVIKLDSGYNTGIKFSEDMDIEKLASGKAEVSFPKAKVTQKKGLPKVTLIYTGGTIGSKVDYKSGGVYTLTKPEELLYEVPELSNIANIEIVPLFSIFSEDMSYLEWQKIAEKVAESLNSGSNGVVVTIGTDTMHYAASALSFMLPNLNAPVAVTGAQRSSDRGSSDAFMNLTCAVAAAARSDIAEVFVCMHASSSDDRCALIRGTRARKMHTSRRDAFKSINDTPIAFVDRAHKITYNNNYKRAGASDKKTDAKTSFEERVALVKIHPNSNPEIMEFYSSNGYKGIILEGTGLGHVAATTQHRQFNWLQHIRNATDKGIVVGMTSQCINGRVHSSVYSTARELSDAGVIYCDDMLPETAYVKLCWLLGNHRREEAARLLNRDLVGEMKKRSGYEEFEEDEYAGESAGK